MANKLTKEKIDLLIEQVLSETVSINIDLSDDKYHKNTATSINKGNTDARTALGLSKSPFQSDMSAKEFAALARDKKKIDAPDFRKAYKSGKIKPERKVADNIQLAVKDLALWDLLASYGGKDGKNGRKDVEPKNQVAKDRYKVNKQREADQAKIQNRNSFLQDNNIAQNPAAQSLDISRDATRKVIYMPRISYDTINQFIKTDFSTFQKYNNFHTNFKTLQSIGRIAQTDLNNIILSIDESNDLRKKLYLLKIFKTIYSGDAKKVGVDDSFREAYYNHFKQYLGPYGELNFDDPGFKLKNLRDEETITPSKSDIFSDDEIVSNTLDNFLTADEKNKALEVFKNLMDKHLTTHSELANLKEINSNEYFDINDFIELLNQGDKAGEKLKPIQQDTKSLISALKDTYKEIATMTSAPEGVGELEKFKRAMTSSIKNLIDAIEYYKSGRLLRTKRGATTGFKIGTAQTSGTSRLDKEVSSLFGRIAPNKSLKEKVQYFENYLNDINNLIKDDKAIEGDIDEKFSKFVALEVLVENMYGTEEASVKGNQFEAFLAMFVQGEQTGADLGGADFQMADGTKGSAKLIGSLEFKQATSNLEDDPKLLYIVGVKTLKTQTGQTRLAKSDDRIRHIDIYLFDVEYRGDAEDGEKHICYAHGDVNSFVYGKKTGTEQKFAFKKIANEAYAGRFDFSFVSQVEFSDVSSKIMKDISASVEKAFMSLTNLRDNITRWIDDKDLVAANQVEYNQKDLKDAIEGLQSEEQLTANNLSETKSLKELDKLIERVILNKMNKL